jgi:hypothetical protein
MRCDALGQSRQFPEKSPIGEQRRGTRSSASLRSALAVQGGTLVGVASAARAVWLVVLAGIRRSARRIQFKRQGLRLEAEGFRLQRAPNPVIPSDN